MKNTTISVILTKKNDWRFNVSLSLQLSFKMSKKGETKEYVMDVPSKYNEIKIKVKYKKITPK